MMTIGLIRLITGLNLFLTFSRFSCRFFSSILSVFKALGSLSFLFSFFFEVSLGPPSLDFLQWLAAWGGRAFIYPADPRHLSAQFCTGERDSVLELRPLGQCKQDHSICVLNWTFQTETEQYCYFRLHHPLKWETNLDVDHC